MQICSLNDHQTVGFHNKKMWIWVKRRFSLHCHIHESHAELKKRSRVKLSKLTFAPVVHSLSFGKWCSACAENQPSHFVPQGLLRQRWLQGPRCPALFPPPPMVINPWSNQSLACPGDWQRGLFGAFRGPRVKELPGEQRWAGGRREVTTKVPMP